MTPQVTLYLLGGIFSLATAYVCSVGAYHSWKAAFRKGFHHGHLVNWGLCMFGAAIGLLVGGGSLVSFGYLVIWG